MARMWVRNSFQQNLKFSYMKKICVIGLGNMGQAVFDLLRKKKFNVSGVDKTKIVNGGRKNAQIFIIAVKPQDFEALAGNLKDEVKKNLIISIMAGISIKKIITKLGAKNVVRVMPNLPLKIGKAFLGWIASKSVGRQDKSFISKILGSLGEEVEMENESQIDAVTALSGSGPAYFYFLTELVEKAALKYGFSKKTAEKIAKSTFLGSAFLMDACGFSAKDLRAKVTSKKGTTEAAINTLLKKKFDKIFGSAVDAAYKRAKQLNKN